ncbi:hypothetical protein SE17_09345 [Kouleothrix aurantiaca]|uniref:Uncharacterized protein n=1 Tax=Kouleothrix aurantiaca TaxID=186479 RepID=A0A0P9D6R2_9CHLR|nr:hypothetical protein SE17_09345 [Kouleothrix aurantiaca]
MREEPPGQRQRAAAEAEADDQNIQVRTEDDAVEEEIDALALETSECAPEDGVIDRLGGEFGIVEQATETLDFALVFRHEWHGGSNRALMSGNGLRDADERTGKRVAQSWAQGGQQLAKAYRNGIIARRGGHGVPPIRLVQAGTRIIPIVGILSTSTKK